VRWRARLYFAVAPLFWGRRVATNYRSKRCGRCELNWPGHLLTCPDCGSSVYNSTNEAMAKDEHDKRLKLIEHRRRRDLPELSDAERAEWEADWAVAAEHGLDEADVIVGMRKRRDAA
jgi:hypothetical protein